MFVLFPTSFQMTRILFYFLPLLATMFGGSYPSGQGQLLLTHYDSAHGTVPTYLN